MLQPKGEQAVPGFPAFAFQKEGEHRERSPPSRLMADRRAAILPNFAKRPNLTA
jgi:hypothetical protein